MPPSASLKFELKPFSAPDYPVVTKIRDAVLPGYPMTAEELRFQDERLPAKCKLGRFLAVHNEQTIAYSEYSQMPFSYDPRRFDVAIYVLPQFQGRGVGSAMFAHLSEQLDALKPHTLKSFAREDYRQSVKFLIERGFEESMRAWESRLDLQAFDSSRYDGHIERVEASGIGLVPLSQIPRTTERDRALYDLDCVLGRDVPHTDPYTPLEFENFVERFIENPGIYPEAYVIAIDGGEYVGMSNLWKVEANQDLYNGLTGVKREYRRRGIALAMKLKNLATAKAAGYPLIKTWNESNNRPMLSINKDLGFVKQPAWISYDKKLSGDAS